MVVLLWCGGEALVIQKGFGLSLLVLKKDDFIPAGGVAEKHILQNRDITRCDSIVRF